MFDDLASARRCAEAAGLDSTGAEPGDWLPWRVCVYQAPDDWPLEADDAGQ